MKLLPKNLSLFLPLVLSCICIFPLELDAQIQTFWVDTSTHKNLNSALFFTNRPVKINTKSGNFEFKNKSVKETNNLFFCLYDYAEDSILIKYRAFDPDESYPVDKVENNIFYKIYEDLRIKKGIKHFSFIIPGYSHTFKSQVHKYMRSLKENYGDSVDNKAAFILYAWGNEWRPDRYFRARRSAQKGANDFAIFQHMLEDFLSDSVYFASHPKDISIYLSCTSMGNELLRKYLLKRERQDIPLQKVYKTIYFIGSDAAWDSFEPGKGFHNIGELCDTVRVVWHDKDIPLKISKTINFKRRMGLHGPRNPENLPGYVTTHDIGNLIRDEDKASGYHNYALSNPDFRKILRDTLDEDDK
jgi:hypothetical protein